MESIQLYEAQPIARLNNTSLATTSLDTANLVALLLNDKRSVHTRRAYTRDLCDFFGCSEGTALEAMATQFCALDVPHIRMACLNYKTNLRERSLSENTINRRLAAIRSLLKFANRLGRSATDGSNVAEGEKVTSYRDTKGVDVATLRKLLAAPERRFGVKTKSSLYIPILAKLDSSANGCVRARENSTRVGIHISRDLALLHLLIENALRRNEVCALDVSDFDASTRGLWITGKGRGNQKERISLSPVTVGAIVAYLAESGHGGDVRGPLFRNLDPNPASHGKRLTGNGLYRLISEYGAFIGLSRLTPHQLRHSAITAALDAGVDVRKVQKMSRHKKLETVLIYDDNRADLQGEVSGIISGLVSGKKKSRAQ